MIRNILIALFACLFPSSAIGGKIFSTAYEQVWFVRFKFPAGAYIYPKVFEEDGSPTKNIDFCLQIKNSDLLKRIDELFNDTKEFEGNGEADDGLVLDALVFYKKGEAVMAIIPNHLGMDLNTQPRLKRGESDPSLSFSKEQLERYDRIVKEALYYAYPAKDLRVLPNKSEQVSSGQPATRSQSMSEGSDKPQP